MMKMARDGKGFAMVLVLFMAVAFSAVVIGDFLSLARQQRSVQQVADRVKTTWVNEALLDYSIQLFSKFVKEKGTYPGLKAKDPTDCSNNLSDADCEVYYRLQGETGGSSFKKELTNWWNNWKAATPGICLNEDLIKIYQTQGTGDSADAARAYTIQFQTEKVSSGVKTAMRYEIRISTGRLFDYFSFANGDLEICPGMDFRAEGPIFANGDVYLMAGSINNPMQFYVPEGIDAGMSDYYIIKTAGRVYSYFKPAVARNYLFCDHMSGSNCVPKASQFQQAYPDFYRTDEPLKASASETAGILTWSNTWATWSVLSSGRKGNWLGWTNSKSNKGLLGLERLYNGLPTLYFFKNHILSGRSSWVRLRVFRGGSAIEDYVLTDRPLPYVAENVPSDLFQRPSYFNPALYGIPYTTSPWGGSQPADVMNVSAAMTLWNPDKYLGVKDSDDGTDWDFQNPVNDTSNVAYNPRFSPASYGTLLQDQSSGVVPQTPPTGDWQSSHLLIEPGKFDDSASVKAQKLWYKAHIQLRCASAACDTFETYVYQGGTGDGYVKVPSSGAYSFASWGNILDWRIGGMHRELYVNVTQLRDCLETQNEKKVSGGFKLDVNGNTFSGYLVYVQTGDAPYVVGGDKIAVVLLHGGSRLPREGLSIVTNGRLWTAGNYNTYDYAKEQHCTDDCDATHTGYCAMWEGKQCHFPPAGIFSDSFGVLSGNSTGGGLTPSAFPMVTASVMVNAAVITGNLPSQFEKAFPDCNASTFLDPTKCFYYPPYAAYPKLGWRSDYATLNSFNGTFDANGYPPRYDAGGSINNSFTSVMRQDKTKGHYHLRTFKNMVANIYDAMYEESYGYPQSSLNDPSSSTNPVAKAFDGCENRKADWMKPIANGGYGMTDKTSSPLAWGPNLPIGGAEKAFYCPQPPVLYPSHTAAYHPPQSTGLYNLYFSSRGSATGWTKWSDVDQATMDEMKAKLTDGTVFKWPTYDRVYRIPVERWNPSTSKWELMCTDIFNPMGPAHVCSQTEIDAGDSIRWRNFKLSFRAIPEIDQYAKDNPNWNREATGGTYFPYFSTGHVNCSGCPSDTTSLTGWQPITTPWCQNGRSKILGVNRPIDYDHCTVEPAPLLPGVFITTPVNKPGYGNFSYPASGTIGLFWSFNTLPCGSEAGACFTGGWQLLDRQLGPQLRTSDTFLTYNPDDYGQTPLYIPHYSGGLENLMNLQEGWDLDTSQPTAAGTKKTVHFQGVLTAGWESKQLRYKTASEAPEKIGYWDPSYYSAPMRQFQYDMDFRTKPPPGMPGSYNVKRLLAQELDAADHSRPLGG